MRRFVLCAALAMLGWPASAHAEWQIRPFIGTTFGTDTTFLVYGHDGTKLVYGASVGLIGNIFGLEADFGRFTGLESGSGRATVLGSSVSTLTGNLTVALPRKMTEYTLRPYFVGGAGLLRLAVNEAVDTFDFTRNVTGFDIGGGVTGFLTKRIGLNWDVRHFRGSGFPPESGLSDGPEQLSFWRANMALAIRY